MASETFLDRLNEILAEKLQDLEVRLESGDLRAEDYALLENGSLPTEQQLLTKAGIAQPTASHWLAGGTKMPKPGALKVVGNFFGCNPDWLECKPGAKRAAKPKQDSGSSYVLRDEPRGADSKAVARWLLEGKSYEEVNALNQRALAAKRFDISRVLAALLEEMAETEEIAAPGVPVRREVSPLSEKEKV
jgi:transcriptional regulator with XRE-family HTH domain